MVIKPTVKTAVLILSVSLIAVLCACGEMSTTLFSSGGTYQVKALVNGNSIENCSIIRQNDKIIPYFAISVVDDPDLMGLLVYLQNSDGDIIGDRVLYTTDPVDDATLIETPQTETEPEDTDSEKTEEGAGVKKEEENRTVIQAESGLPKQIMEKRTSIETKPAAKKYDKVILIKSFEQEMPNFPLPKNMEIGAYTLIFEAVSRSATLSFTETYIFYLGGMEFKLKDISMYLPWLSDTSLIPPGVNVLLEAGLDFDSSLNPYVIWYNGKNVISEGSISEGAGKILWKAPEQAGFYSLRLEVLPYKLKQNYTGIFREITIPVSAKAAPIGYFFENGPDYHAKRPLVAGTAYPEYARQAAEGAGSALAGSATAGSVAPANTDAAAPIPAPEPLRWYRFDGSLDETSLKPERVFKTENENLPRWAAAGQSYGLSADKDDNYFLKPVSFFRKGQDQGGGIFLFYIKPVTEGTVFSAFFPTSASASESSSTGDGVWMDMAARENVITLRLRTRGTTVEMPVNPGYAEKQGLIPIVVEFYIRPYRFEAKLSLGEDLLIQGMTGEIELSGVLSGEGRINLGADKTAPAGNAGTKKVLALPNFIETEKTAEFVTGDIQTETVPSESVNAANTTIWDEFAILYSATPLLPEEIINEETPLTEEESDAILSKNKMLTEVHDKETASAVFLQ